MFKTIFTVNFVHGESAIFDACFEDLDSAKNFAKEIVRKTDDDFVSGRKNYLDGSFCYHWIGDCNEIWLDDFAWVTDRPKGVVFYNHEGLKFEFGSYDEFQKFIIRSQEIAKS